MVLHYRLSWDIFNCKVCVLNHLVEERSVGSALSGCEHKDSTQSAAAAGEECDHPAHSAGQTSPDSHGANTIHNTPSYWTTRRARGTRQRPKEGPLIQSHMLVCHSTTSDKQKTGRHTHFFLASSYCQLTFTLSTKWEESWEPYWNKKGIKELKMYPNNSMSHNGFRTNLTCL